MDRPLRRSTWCIVTRHRQTLLKLVEERDNAMDGPWVEPSPSSTHSKQLRKLVGGVHLQHDLVDLLLASLTETLARVFTLKLQARKPGQFLSSNYRFLCFDRQKTDPTLFTNIIKNENTLQLWDQRFRRNSSLQAVCDTPIARITSCVSSLRI